MATTASTLLELPTVLLLKNSLASPRVEAPKFYLPTGEPDRVVVPRDRSLLAQLDTAFQYGRLQENGCAYGSLFSYLTSLLPVFFLCSVWRSFPCEFASIESGNDGCV
jgi:hypothetical protein